MFVDPWLERAAALRPERVAIETPEGTRTYAELLAGARRRAKELGAGPGDRVPITVPPGIEFAETLHACLLAGAAAMPGAWNERSNNSNIRDIAAVVVHTSGTTGEPRPVELTRENIQANALGSAIALGLDPRERWLCPLPLSHVGGLMVLLRSAIYATTAVIAGLDRIHDVTLASLVPTQLRRVIDEPPPPRLRAILLGGAPPDKALLVRARDAGWPVAPTYGLTQACSSVTIAEPGDVETSGRPLPGLRVAIDAGEILVEGPTVAGGGTLRTGDLGRLDDRGRLIVTGRKGDTIVTGGENVAPAEVEAVLLQHPAVADAAVFGRADPEWGEAVTARVVLRAAATPDELRAHAREHLARFEVPKKIEVADALPRSASGKLLRRELGLTPRRGAEPEAGG